MAVLVIGGAGFIGSHLVDELLVQRFEVMVVDNLSTGMLENIERWRGHQKLEFVRADADDPDVRTRMVDHKSWVFNFAPVKKIYELVDSCCQAGVRRFVDNTSELTCSDWEQELSMISLKYGAVYGPRGPRQGDVFVSDIVRINMMAAMNAEVQGLLDVKDTVYWQPQITQEQGAQIIELYEKNVGKSLVVVPR